MSPDDYLAQWALGVQTPEQFLAWALPLTLLFASGVRVFQTVLEVITAARSIER